MRQAKRIHNPKEQGAALIVVMSIILILTVLAAGTFNNSVRDFTIAMNRNYAQAAEQIAQSALHLALNRIEQDPLGFITALTQKQAEAQNPTGCAQAKTLCLTPASFFPETNASSNLPHKGFNIKALLPDITLKTNSAPSVYPDFVVKIDPPIRSPYSKPAAGMSINNFAKMCTITLILTATGKVINPNVPNTNTHRHVLSQRIYRVHINVAAKGDAC